MQTKQTQQVSLTTAMVLAQEHHQAGRLPEAEAIYRAILQIDSSHAAANYNLGLVALQRGRPGDAIPVLKAALDADQRNSAHWLNYAVALAASGDPVGARNTLLDARQRGLGGNALADMLAQMDRLIGRSSTSAEGGVPGSVTSGRTNKPPSDLMRLYREGKYAELQAEASRQLDSNPNFGLLWYLLGAARLALGGIGEARDALARARDLVPDSPMVLNLLGLALRQSNENEDARAVFAQCLTIAPDHFDALLNASANAVTLGNFEEARLLAERAVAIRPEAADALRVLGDAHAASGMHADAAELYRRAAAIDPASPDLWVNLSAALINLDKTEDAADAASRALSLRSDSAAAHSSLARALYALGETAAAREHYRTASDLAPEDAEAHTAYLFCLAHDESISPEQCYEEHVRIGDLIERPLKPAWLGHDNDRDPNRALRIGFVSGDFRAHPVANLIEPVWQAMKGGGNRIIAYSNVPSDDPVRDRLCALADEWVQVERLDDEALCRRIRADRIDILIDLSGHTTHNRLTAFARRPAPIQVTWLGYPGTTGLSAMDYRFIRGRDATQGGLGRLFREKLVYFRLRGFSPEADAPPVVRLPALEKGYVTFGSFNRPGKIGDSVIALWSRVLVAVPGSRLLVAGISEARMEERLAASFAAHGVARDRLDFRPRLPIVQYLAMHQDVDVALDTFPYTGGTTTSNALWMGVPVVTLAGESLQQNQSAAILRMAGLDDWVTTSEDAFVRRACAAASDPLGLNQLRMDLRERARRVFQHSPEELGGELEAAFRTMWQRWCAGLPPESFTVTA